jgi:hypothetical protein
MQEEIRRLGHDNAIPERYALLLDAIAQIQLPPATMAKMLSGRMQGFQNEDYNPQNPLRAKSLHKLTTDLIKREAALRFAFVTAEGWRNSIGRALGEDRDGNGIRQEVLYVGAVSLYNEIKPVVKECRVFMRQQEEIDRDVRQVLSGANIVVEAAEKPRAVLGARLQLSADAEIQKVGKALLEGPEADAAMLADIPMERLVEQARIGEEVLKTPRPQ